MNRPDFRESAAIRRIQENWRAVTDQWPKAEAQIMYAYRLLCGQWSILLFFNPTHIAQSLNQFGPHSELEVVVERVS